MPPIMPPITHVDVVLVILALPGAVNQLMLLSRRVQRRWHRRHK